MSSLQHKIDRALNSSPTHQSNPKNSSSANFYNSFFQSRSKLAEILIGGWCLLPALMCLYLLLNAVLGRLPTDEALAVQGLARGDVTYSILLDAYRLLYYFLGALTFLFAVFSVLVSHELRQPLEIMKRSPWYLPFVLFLIWAFVCSLRSQGFARAITGSSYMNTGLLSFCIFGSILVSASLVQEPHSRLRLLRLFSGVICFLAIFMILQELTNSMFLNYTFGSRRATVFNQFNHFGYILCMGSLTLSGLFLYDRNCRLWLRILYVLGFLLLIYALILNDTFGAWLAVEVALPITLVVYWVSKKGKALRGVVPLCLFLLVCAGNISGILPGPDSLKKNLNSLSREINKAGISASAETQAYRNSIGEAAPVLLSAHPYATQPVELSTVSNADAVPLNSNILDSLIDFLGKNQDAGTERLGLWRDTLIRIRRSPIFGYGPEGLYGRYAIRNNFYPHNEYLQCAADTGIPGLILYMLGFLCLWLHPRNRARRLDGPALAAAGAALGYLISAFFGAPVFNTMPYLWMLLGFATAGGATPMKKPEIQDSSEA